MTSERNKEGLTFYDLELDYLTNYNTLMQEEI